MRRLVTPSATSLWAASLLSAAATIGSARAPEQSQLAADELQSTASAVAAHPADPAVGADIDAASTPVESRAGRTADSMVRTAMREHRIPGVCLAVVRDGRIIKATAYGYANLEWKVPMRTDALFQSGSVAKQFTAAAVLMLAGEGRLRLDDPVSKYLPESAHSAWSGVTLRQLLNHTSGIPDIFSDKDEDEYDKGILDFRRDYTEEELLQRFATVSLDFPPGTQWNYSNTGYEILGVVIHRASGRFYGDLLQERIFKPLGMTDTRIISEEDIVPRRVAGYRILHGALKNQEWMPPSLNTTADGGLYLTVFDLAKWDAALYGDKVLSKAAMDQMRTPARLASGKTYPYGMGWELGEQDGHPVEFHTGSNQGFAISLSRYVRDRLTVIVLTNLDSSHSVTLGIARPVASLYFQPAAARAGASSEHST